MKDGLVQQAKTGYTEILNDEPQSDCAANGLHRVAQQRCDHARRLVERNATAEAKSAFTALLTSEPPEPSATCAIEGLEEIARNAAATSTPAKGKGGVSKGGGSK